MTMNVNNLTAAGNSSYPKNTKSQQIETFLHVIDDKKSQVLENPYRETPKGILYVQQKS